MKKERERSGFCREFVLYLARTYPAWEAAIAKDGVDAWTNWLNMPVKAHNTNDTDALVKGNVCQCVDCGCQFVAKYSKPTRCPTCRARHKRDVMRLRNAQRTKKGLDKS